MRWWLWPNVLSLDAPVVATLWHLAFAKAHGVWPQGRTLALLAAAVWMIYVLDRLLDARRARGGGGTRRHAFHARHQRLFFVWLSVVGLAGGSLLFFVNQRVLTFGSGMLLLSFLYGWLVHGRRLWIPKELFCGAMFSAGVVGPLFLDPFPWLAAGVFAGLCAGNCLVIACSEAGLDRRHDPWALPQRWPGVGPWLAGGLGFIAILSAACVYWGPAGMGHGLFGAMGIAGVGLLFVRGLAFDVEQRRVLADVCLLTPLLVWPWL